MERGGEGFHGYRKIPTSSCSAGPKLSDINMKLPEVNYNNNINYNMTGDDNKCTVREQDRFMPIANVIRIMRKILPPHAKISDDAKETIQECVSEYISFITGEANERCQREQRKTITAEDVLFAMSKLGFDDYVEPLTVYLHRYRDLEGGDRGGSVRGDSMMMMMMRSTVVDYNHHHPGFFGGGGYFNEGGNGSGPSISNKPVQANGGELFAQPK